MNLYCVYHYNKDGNLLENKIIIARHQTEAIDIGIGDSVTPQFYAYRRRNKYGVSFLTIMDETVTTDFWRLFCVINNIKKKW